MIETIRVVMPQGRSQHRDAIHPGQGQFEDDAVR
jgi:hypothetical protein